MPRTAASLALASALALLSPLGCRGAAPPAPEVAPATAPATASTAEVLSDRTDLDLHPDHRALEIHMLGRKFGDIRFDRERLADGGERWTSRMTLSLALDDPGENAVQVEILEVSEYGPDRALLRSSEVTREGDVEESTDIRRDGADLVVRVRGPSHDREHRLPIPPDFADATDLFDRMRREIEAGAAAPRSATYSAFNSKRLRFETHRLTVLGHKRVAVGGAELDAWDTESVDEDGERTLTLFDAGAMPLRATFAAFVATLPGAPIAAPAADLKISSYLEVRGTIDPAAATLTIAVDVPDDDPTAPPLFRDSAYQVVQRDGRSYTLTLHAVRGDGLSPRTLPLRDLPDDVRRHLEPTPTSQSDAPAIVARARELVGARTDTREVAVAIIDWVHAHTDKRDGTRGAATAVETLTAGFGDCTEHTALAVALLRAAGLPARNTSGIVLLPDPAGAQAGFHAWVEVWLGDWVVMDPALGPTRVGPHYLFLGHDEPGMRGGGSELVRLLGRTTIRVDP